MQTSTDEAETDTETGFVIDKVPGGGYTWTLLDHRGDVLARAGHAYPTKQDAQLAIAETQIASREHDVPTHIGT